jgi:hypothetical protein
LTGFKRAALVSLQAATFQAGEIILHSHEFNDKIYLLLRGTAEEVENEMVVRSISSGNVFGDRSFLTRTKQLTSVRCVADADVFMLNRHDFFEAAHAFPTFLEHLETFHQDRQRFHSSLSPSHANQLEFQDGLSSPSDNKKPKRGRLFQMIATEAGKEKKSIPGYIIPLNSSLRQVLSICSLVLLVQYWIMIPFFACFASSIASDSMPWSWLVVFWIVDVFFAVDFYLRCFHMSISETESGEEIIDWSSIFSYQRNSVEFYIDMLALVPLEIIMHFPSWSHQNNPSYTFWLRLNKLLLSWRVPRLWADVKRWIEQHLMLNQGYVRIAGLGFAFLYATHILGCLFFFVSKNEPNEATSKTWVAVAGLEEKPISYQYIRSIYWALVTCATIGYIYKTFIVV